MISNYKITLLLLSLLFIFSCKQKDDASTLGLDVQPENDLLNITITDTSSIFMHTQRVDSVRTYNDGVKFLGSVNDPVFGRTDAAIYTNFSIANNLTNVSFGSDAVLDSAEMIIAYTNAYVGDTTNTLTYKVHLLNEKINNTLAYYTTQKFNSAQTIVNTTPGKFANRGGVWCLVFKLDYNMAKYILETDANLTNNTGFQNANKGFYITTETSSLSSGQGSIRQFNLDNLVSGVNLHYHNTNAIIPKGEVFQFSFRGTDAARTNYIKHDYTSTSTNLKNQLNNIDTTLGAQSIYVNTFGGTRGRIYLPYLKNFSDSQVVSISRAELIIKIDPTTTDLVKYRHPIELALIGCSSVGKEELVWDQIESSDFIKYNGNFDATNNQYVFNIARHMQKIVTNKISNYGFYLVNANPNKSDVVRRDNRKDRIVIGGKSSIYKPIFKVTYVKYPYDK